MTTKFQKTKRVVTTGITSGLITSGHIASSALGTATVIVITTTAAKCLGKALAGGYKAENRQTTKSN